MKTATKKIVAYLKKHGRMSGRDIINDINVDEFDIDEAYNEGAIMQVNAPPNASSFPWWGIRKRR